MPFGNLLHNSNNYGININYGFFEVGLLLQKKFLGGRL
jgi:hypothetical protein